MTAGCAPRLHLNCPHRRRGWRTGADYDHVLTMQARRRRLDAAIEEMAAASEFTPVVRRMCCLCGVSTLTGFGLAVEIGDWTRFTGFRHRLVRRAGALGVFLGVVPGPGIDHQDRQHPRS